MKNRNYERKELVTFSVFILIIIEILEILLLVIRKTYNYQTISGIVLKENTIAVMITKRQRMIVYSSKLLNWNNKWITYEVLEDHGIVLKRNKDNYYELIIGMKIPKEKKTNDTLELNLRTNKHSWIDLFKIIWGR